MTLKGVHYPDTISKMNILLFDEP